MNMWIRILILAIAIHLTVISSAGAATKGIKVKVKAVEGAERTVRFNDGS